MVLEIENVHRTFPRPGGGEVGVLRGVSLRLDARAFVAVRGASGSGKSTLLLTAGGLLRPSRGRVRLGESDPYALSANARAGLRAERIGFVFQQFHLLPYLNVRENILSPIVALARNGAEERAEELMTRFGLIDRADHVPAKLSVGERQRTALARALLNRPPLLLADEPTGNLDDKNSDIVLRAFVAFAQEGGAVLMVTHDERAAGFAQKRLRLEAGRLDEQRDNTKDEDPVP